MRGSGKGGWGRLGGGASRTPRRNDRQCQRLLAEVDMVTCPQQSGSPGRAESLAGQGSAGRGGGGRTAVSAQGLWRSFAVKGRRETGQRFKHTWVVLLQVRQMLSG